MHPRTLALVIAATALTAGCLSNEAKPDAATPAPAAKAAEPAPPPAKPECPPEPATKKKTEKTSKKAASKKTEEAPPPDCEPAKPKTAAAAPAKAAEPPPPAKESTTGKACNPCTVKSRDGAFTGEIYGTIPPGSKWARLQIGMQQSEVERILGVTQNIRAYVTAKAFIPFYYGTDSHRYEAVYAGQGSVAYTGGGMGGGQGVLMMINFDPKVQ
ncbi:MAG TPA: hypothetical protein VN639_21000 [Azonexus sp.]|nr:hypothetical protein [Azonexus sp.]